MKALQLFLIVIFCHLSVNARIPDNMRFSHIGLDDGLSHSTVVDIRQDNDGNLWFATHDGVNKYDGYDFTVYRHQYAESSSIASDMSRCLSVDGVGRVGVGTREGLSLYNPRTDSFVNFFYQKNGQNVTINSIVSVDDSVLMLGTTEGLLLFDIVNKKFFNDPLPAGLHKISVTALSKGHQCVYVGGNGLVYRYVMDRGVLEKLMELPSEISIQAIFSQGNDRIWVATEGSGLYRYDRKSKELREYHDSDRKLGLNSDYVRSLGLDSDNNLWVGTYDGLNIYDEDADNFVSVKNSEIEDGSLSQNSVRCIFQDSQGGMWLGTYWGGLNYYHPLCNRFKTMKHVPQVNSLSDNVVNCIVEDNGHNLWIGTSGGGLNYYDNVKKAFKNYLFASDEHGVPFKDIKTVYVDELRDRVYVGAHAGGMMVVHRKSGNVEYYNRNNSNLPINHIYSIVSDGNGGLWIAALDYLLHFDIDKRDFKVVNKVGNDDKI
ncbi:MAG: hybrid sensor histidine kinase/response regulator, partial [Muribaculaceae bacterium]|nr:hybrid sensor histidine kinase/response regulator [Muribaculaceae bacterium]